MHEYRNQSRRKTKFKPTKLDLKIVLVSHHTHS